MKPDVNGFFHANTNTVTYVVSAPGGTSCVIIDPVLDFDQASGRTGTASIDEVLAYADNTGLRPAFVLETHVHADHLSAAPYVREVCAAKIAIGSGVNRVKGYFEPVLYRQANTTDSADGDFDILLNEADGLDAPDFHVQVINTPGHTAGCVTYVIGNAAFVGDTLFMPDFGTARTDFPGGDAKTLYHSVRKILALPAATRLYMCHDYKAPGREEFAWETTVQEQREHNIHINERVSEAQFVQLREARDAQLSVPALLLPSVQINLRAGNLPQAEADSGIQYLKIPLNQF